MRPDAERCLSKLLVSPLITPIVILHRIPDAFVRLVGGCGSAARPEMRHPRWRDMVVFTFFVACMFSWLRYSGWSLHCLPLQFSLLPGFSAEALPDYAPHLRRSALNMGS